MPSSCNAQVLRVRVSYLFRYGHRTQGLSWKKGNEQRDRVFTSSSCKQARRGMPATSENRSTKRKALASTQSTERGHGWRNGRPLCIFIHLLWTTPLPPPLPSSLPQEPRANGDGQGEEVIRWNRVVGRWSWWPLPDRFPRPFSPSTTSAWGRAACPSPGVSARLRWPWFGTATLSVRRRF